MSAPRSATEKTSLLTADNTHLNRDRTSTYSSSQRFSTVPQDAPLSLSQRLRATGRSGPSRQWAVRGLALLCACSLSVGAHYGREFLGPIKSRLAREIGSSNSDFSIILASYSVNNTWTPLVAGLLASRLGTARTSLLATSLILGGQSVLLLGRSTKNIGVMAAGLFIFGLGISPVSVVQETIIVRFFAKANLGIFLSIGLLLGKASGFFSALSSFPLSELNPLMPFIVSTLLAAFSFSINVVYLVAGPWLAKGAGVAMEDAERERSHSLRKLTGENSNVNSVRSTRAISLPEDDEEEDEVEEEDEERRIGTHRHGASGIRSPDSPASSVTALEGEDSDLDIPGGQKTLHDPADTQPLMLSQREAEEVIARKKRVILHEIVKLGDVFWLYLAFNFLCGSIWSPFTHIAANLFQVRYGYSEANASWTASFLHAGSLVLYPIAGYISDRSRQEFIVYKLALLSSIMTLTCYFWLLLPVETTKSAMPGVILFGTATGFSTLLLVLMVPRLVPPRYVPTALGAHKSIESAGSTISVTLAGAILDRAVLAVKTPREGKAPAASSIEGSSSSYFAARVSNLLAIKAESGGPLNPTPRQQKAAWDILAGFFLVNCLSIACILLLWKLDRRRRAAIAAAAAEAEYTAVSSEEIEEADPVETFEDEEAAEEGDSPTSQLLAPSTSNSERERTSSIRSTTPLIRPANPFRQGAPSSSAPSSSTQPQRQRQASSSPSRSRRPLSTASRTSARHGSHSDNPLEDALTPTPSSIVRGKVFFILCACVIFGAWAFYVITLAKDISKRRHKAN